MNHTRITALLLTALLCLPAAALSACNGNTNHPQDQQKVAEPVAVDHVWSTDYISLPEDINVWQFENPQYDGNLLSFAAERILDKETYETEHVQVTYDFTTGEISYTAVPSFDEETYGYAQYVLTTPENTTIAIFQNYDEITGSTLWSMTAFDAETAELWTIDLSAQFQQLDDPQWMYINDCIIDADGTIFAFADRNIVALSPDGKRLFEIKVDNYIDDVFTTADGTIYLSYYSWDEMTGDGGYEYRALDTEKKGLGDALAIPDSINLDNAEIHMADGYDMYYTNTTGLYALNFTDTESTLLCNWVNSDLIESEISYRMKVLSDHRAVFLTDDPVSGTPQLAVMSPVAPEDVTPKYLIEVAYAENGNNMMQRYAVAFNRDSDQYRVVLNDYSGYYTADTTPMDVLSQEIIAGDIPDIILADSYNLNADDLVRQGLFRDMYSFMDAEGESMNRSAFVPCVLTPMEEVDGTLPLLVQNFRLSTYAVKSSLVGGKTSWSIDDLMAFCKTLNDDQYLFSAYFNNDPENGESIPMQVLNMILPYSLSAFIDETAGTCSLNDGRFASLLQFCLEAPVLNAAEIESETDLFRNDKLMLMEMRHFSDVSDYLQKKYYVFGGEDMTLIGYPTFDDSVNSGTAMQPETMFGITNASVVADGAWQFIKRTFGDVENDHYYSHNGFSSARGALERTFAKEERSYYIFEENGWSGTHYDEDDEIDLSWMDEQIEMMGGVGVPGHMEPEDRDALMAIFEGNVLVAQNDETLLDMIREDASAYFAGAKSLEETVKVIQSRVSIYVAEHS